MQEQVGRQRGDEIPALIKYQVVKGRQTGHKVRLANPTRIPGGHLGNEGQLVNMKSRIGTQVKVCLIGLL